MFKIHDSQNSEIFKSSRDMVNYCLKTLRLPSKAIITLIANGKYGSITLEFL